MDIRADDANIGVPSKSVFQQVSELGVSIRNVRLLFLGEFMDDLSQGKQAGVSWESN